MAQNPDVSIKIGVDEKDAINKVSEFEKKVQAKLKDSLKAKISTSVDQREFDTFAKNFKSTIKKLEDGSKLNLGIKVDSAGEIPKFKKKVDDLRKQTGQDINVRFNIKQESNAFNQIIDGLKSVRSESTNLSNQVSLLKLSPKVDLSELKRLESQAEILREKLSSVNATGVSIKSDVSSLLSVQKTLESIRSDIEKSNNRSIGIKAFLNSTVGKELDVISDKVGGLQKLTAAGFTIKFFEVGLDGIMATLKGVQQFVSGGLGLVMGIEGNTVALEQALFNQNKKGGESPEEARKNASLQGKAIADAIVEFAAVTPFTSSNIFGLGTVLQNRGFDVMAGTNGGTTGIRGAGYNNILNVASDLIARQVLIGKTQDEATNDFARAIAEFKSGQYVSLKTRFDIGNQDIVQAIVDQGLSEKTGISKADDLTGENVAKLSNEEVIGVFGAISKNLGAEGLSEQQSLTLSGLLSTLGDNAERLLRAFFGDPKDGASLFSELKNTVTNTIKWLEGAGGDALRDNLSNFGESIGRFVEEVFTPENINSFGEAITTMVEGAAKMFAPENITNFLNFLEVAGEIFEDRGLLGLFTAKGSDVQERVLDKSIEGQKNKIGELENSYNTETDPIKKENIRTQLDKERGTLSVFEGQQTQLQEETGTDKGVFQKVGEGVVNWMLGRGELSEKVGEGSRQFLLGKEGGEASYEWFKSIEESWRMFFEETIPEFFNSIPVKSQELWDSLTTQAKTFLDEAWNSTTEFFSNSVQSASEWGENQYNQLVAFKDNIVNNVFAFLNQDWSKVLEDMAFNLGFWIGERYGVFETFLTVTIPEFFNSIPTKSAEVWNNITSYINTKSEEIKTFITGIPGHAETEFNKMKESSSAKWNELVSYSSNKVNELILFISLIPLRSIEFFNSMKDGAIGKFNEMKDSSVNSINSIRDAIGEIPSTFNAGLDNMLAKANTIFESIKTKAQEASNAISNAGNNAKSGVTNAWDSFISGFNEGKETRATGGAVFAGRDYQVGEEGKELFRGSDGRWDMLTGGDFSPNRDGFIFPNNITEKLLSRVQPNNTNTTTTYNFDNTFELPSSGERQSGYYAANKLLSQFDKELRGQII